jgi:hypothetical protein
MRFSTFLFAVVLTLAACATQAPTGGTVGATPEAYANIPYVGPESGTTVPKAIRHVELKPPYQFVRSHHVAQARAEVVIDASGNVVDAWHVDGNRELGQLFVTSLRGWKFEPATVDGVPASVRFRMTTTFRKN